MLYGIGLMLLLLSASFVGGSVVVPVTMVFVGIVLMRFGRRVENGNKTNTKRQSS